MAQALNLLQVGWEINDISLALMTLSTFELVNSVTFIMGIDEFLFYLMRSDNEDMGSVLHCVNANGRPCLSTPIQLHSGSSKTATRQTLRYSNISSLSCSTGLRDNCGNSTDLNHGRKFGAFRKISASTIANV